VKGGEGLGRGWGLTGKSKTVTLQMAFRVSLVGGSDVANYVGGSRTGVPFNKVGENNGHR